MALRLGLQKTLLKLGSVPKYHKTDNSTAATHLLGASEQASSGKRRGYNHGYLQLLAHYSIQPLTTNNSTRQENGDVEASNGALKRALEQHLLLRGSRDFDGLEEWSGPGTVDSSKLGKKEMNMPRTRTPYSLEFRQQILELLRTGRTPSELAREFEPSGETIRQWVKQAELDAGQRQDGLTTDQKDEIAQLRREVKRLKQEQEILKKAAAWFAQETNLVPPRSSSS